MNNPYVYTCESCNKLCRPLVSVSNPLAAPEYYCERCHKSYKMDKDHVSYHLEQQKYLARGR